MIYILAWFIWIRFISLKRLDQHHRENYSFYIELLFFKLWWEKAFCLGTWKTLGVRKGLDRIALVILRADWDIGCLETWEEGRLAIGKRVKKCGMIPKPDFGITKFSSEYALFVSFLLFCIAFSHKTPNLV